MKYSALVKAMGVVLVMGVVIAPPADAGAIVGATEFTQIANNIELVSQYEKQIEQVATQVKQYEAQLKSLRKLDSGKLQGMLKGIGGADASEAILSQLSEASALREDLRSLDLNMNTIYREGKVAYDVSEMLKKKGHDIKPSDYVGMMKALAAEKDEVYGERLRVLDKAAFEARNDMERVRKISETSQTIATDVEGLGALVQSSGIMSSQLAGLHQTINEAAAMDVRTAQLLEKQVDEQDMQKKRTEQWMNSALLPASGAK